MTAQDRFTEKIMKLDAAGVYPGDEAVNELAQLWSEYLLESGHLIRALSAEKDFKAGLTLMAKIMTAK